MAKTGRPSTYTTVKAGAVYGHLCGWRSLPDAFALAGVPESTGRGWMEQFPDFSEGIKRARAQARQEALDTIKKGNTGKDGPAWQSAAWFLERSDFENWGNKSRQEITGADGGPLIIEDTATDTTQVPSHNGSEAKRQTVIDALNGGKGG